MWGCRGVDLEQAAGLFPAFTMFPGPPLIPRPSHLLFGSMHLVKIYIGGTACLSSWGFAFMNCVGLLWKLIHADDVGWGDNSFQLIPDLKSPFK